MGDHSFPPLNADSEERAFPPFAMRLNTYYARSSLIISPRRKGAHPHQQNGD
jgi:hypothetical protein